jgi:ubiquinone/menaquinone biosynthesis C-methylase UbiE
MLRIILDVGERVLDIGSGLGVDSFIAADAVSTTGSVTGKNTRYFIDNAW